jgi:flagellar protein FlaG
MSNELLAVTLEVARVSQVGQTTLNTRAGRQDSGGSAKPAAEASTRAARADKAEAAQNLPLLQKELQAHNVELQFSRDQDTGLTVLKLVDSHTGEALEQIPHAVSLILAAAFSKLQGHLIDRQA